MAKQTRKFSVVAPADLFAEIEEMRAALGARCDGIEPQLSAFAIAAMRRGLEQMKAEGVGR